MLPSTIASRPAPATPAAQVLRAFGGDFRRWESPAMVAGPDSLQVKTSAIAPMPIADLVSDSIRGVKIVAGAHATPDYPLDAARAASYIALLDGVRAASFDTGANELRVTAATPARARLLDEFLRDDIAAARVVVGA